MRDLSPYYELHLTLNPVHRDRALAVLGHGWHYSVLKGDEVLGADVRGYLTRRADTLLSAQRRLSGACILLAEVGVPWVRRKIEIALLDEVTE